MERAPARPERMFIQFHGGVYRSDDAGSSWSEIGAGLPSDFGFPLAVDPADPDSAYVIPLVADMDRVTPEGRVRVYETRDGGETWAPRGDGLPQKHAYLTVLRQAFQRKGSGPSLEIYFGSTYRRGVRLGRRGGDVVRGHDAAPAGVCGVGQLKLLGLGGRAGPRRALMQPRDAFGGQPGRRVGRDQQGRAGSAPRAGPAPAPDELQASVGAS